MDGKTKELVTRLHADPNDRARLDAVRAHLREVRQPKALAKVLEWWASKTTRDGAAALALVEAAGLVLEATGDEARARELQDQALERAPDNDVVAHALLASAAQDPARRASLARRRYAALEARGAAVESVRSARVALAEALGDLGTEESRDEAVALLEPDARAPATAVALVELYAARAGASEGALAQRDRRRASRLLAYLARVEPDRAEAHLTRAVEIDPANGSALEALEALVPASAMVPRWRAHLAAAPRGARADAVRARLARALMAEGERDEARTLAETMAPGHPERDGLLAEVGAGTDASRMALLADLADDFDSLPPGSAPPREQAPLPADMSGRLDPAPTPRGLDMSALEASPGPEAAALDLDARPSAVEADGDLDDFLASEAPEAEAADPFELSPSESPTVAGSVTDLPLAARRPASETEGAGTDELDVGDLQVHEPAALVSPAIDAPAVDAARLDELPPLDVLRAEAAPEPAPPEADLASFVTSAESSDAIPQLGGRQLNGDSADVAPVPAVGEPAPAPVLALVAPSLEGVPAFGDEDDDEEAPLLALRAERLLPAGTVEASGALVVEALRLREGKVVHAQTLRGPLSRLRGFPGKVKVGRAGAQVTVKEAESLALEGAGGQTEAGSVGAPIALAEGTRMRVQLDDGALWLLRVGREVDAVPVEPRQVNWRRLGLGAAAALVFHLALAAALVVTAIANPSIASVDSRPTEEIFAEARLRPPEERPEPPRPRRTRPRPPTRTKAPPRETRTQIPQTLRNRLRQVNRERSGDDNARLMAALTTPNAGSGETLNDVVSNIDAVNAGGPAGTLSISGTLSALEGVSGVNVARSAGGPNVGSLGGRDSAGEASMLDARMGSGRVRGRARGVSALARVQGSLSRGEIKRVVDRAVGRIQRCYERQLNTNPSLSGRVVFAWTIQPNGRVSGARAAQNSLGSNAAVSCMQGVIRGLRFPRPSGGPVTVSAYPFVFQMTQ